jgi:hypothetical protein
MVTVLLLIASAKKATETAHGPPRSGLLYLQLEHNIGGLGQFVPRGAIQFKAVKSSAGTFIQQNRLTNEDIMSLKSMAEMGELYRLRTQSKLSSAVSEEENVEFISTATKACLLVQSGLTETITVHKDEAGNVFGLSLSVPGIACEFSKAPKKGSLPAIFNTTVVVSHGGQGSVYVSLGVPDKDGDLGFQGLA